MTNSQLAALVLIAQAVLTLVLVVITGLYAWQTRRQADASRFAVDEMRRTREAQARAYVTVELWPWDRNFNLFDLAIRNYGAGAARDVKIRFLPDIPHPGFDGGTLSELEVFRDLPFLAPHDELVFFLGKREHIMDTLRIPQVWEGMAQFTDDTGQHETSIRINLKEIDRLRCTLPYGEPPGAPPIRRGWGRRQLYGETPKTATWK